MVASVSIPCIPNHANLIVYPSKQKVIWFKVFPLFNLWNKQGASVYLLSLDGVKPEWSLSRQVEFEEGYVYCLLPSVGTQDGFARLYSSMPGFVRDLPFHQFLGKVNVKIIPINNITQH